MKPISSSAHGILDYVTVVVFAAAPAVLGLAGLAGAISYALAAIHLAMTLATDFPYGVLKLVAFRLHGWVERVVGPVLVVLPFVAGMEGVSRIFYVVMGAVIIVVGFATRYSEARAP